MNHEVFGLEGEQGVTLEGTTISGPYGQGDGLPPLPSLTAETQRVNVIPVTGDPTSVTVIGSPRREDNDNPYGRATARLDGNVTYDLTDRGGTPPAVALIDIEKVIDGETIAETIRVAVNRCLQDEGNVRHGHYALDIDSNRQFVVEPDENTKRMYITKSPSVLTEAIISARHGNAAVTQSFLRNTLAKDENGVDQTHLYGEREAYAITEELAERMWPRWRGDRTSVWVGFERGYTYNSNLALSSANETAGMSPLHPRHAFAWGTGEKPKIVRGAPAIGITNAVTQGIDITQSASPDDVVIYFRNGSDKILSDCNTDNVEISTRADYRRTSRFTMHRVIFPGTHKIRPSGLTYSPHGDRKFSLYATRIRGLLIKDCAFFYGGWFAPYDFYNTTALNQPPSQFSHNIYINDTCYDFCIEGSSFWLGANTGGQIRGGAVVRNNLFAGANNVVFTARGPSKESVFPGLYASNNSHLLNNFMTWPGRRRYQDLGENSGLHNIVTGSGWRNSSRGAVAVGNVAAFSGTQGEAFPLQTDPPQEPVNDGWDRGDTGPSVVDTRGGSRLFDDTKTYGWFSEDPRNVDGLSTSEMDQASLIAWGQAEFGGNLTEMDVANTIRGLPNPETYGHAIVANAMARFDETIPTHTVGQVCDFQPSTKGTPGRNWRNHPDWADGQIPGQAEGDEVRLWGHLTNDFDVFAHPIRSIDFGGGEHQQTGGRLDLTDGFVGTSGKLTVDIAGQAFVSGNVPSGHTVEVNDGRFGNEGTLNIGGELILHGTGEALLGWENSLVTVQSGGILDLRSAQAKAGADGLAGGTSVIDLQTGSTLKISSSVDVEVNLLDQDDDLEIGEVYEGLTSGAQGTVTVATYFARLEGFVTLENVTGVFQQGETLRRIQTASGTVVANDRATITSVTSPTPARLRKFFSGYQRHNTPGTQDFAPVNQTFNVSAQSGVTLEVNLNGLTTGTYPLIQSDAVPGTFTLSQTGTLAGGSSAALDYSGSVVNLLVS